MNTDLVAKNSRILIVDDNRAIHDDFRKILGMQESSSDALVSAAARMFGGSIAGSIARTTGPTFDLESAFQGSEGLASVVRACAEGRPFALAFVDMRMPPGWGGLETITKLWEVQPDLQIVICTAYSDYSWDELFKKLGRSDRLLILKKPFDNIEVQQLATALTEKWRVTQQAQLKLGDLEKLVQQRTQELETTMDQLAQSRKMEAIGQLAGGVAHDYNNILTATLIQLDLLSSNPEVTSGVRLSLRELEKMAHRAASLTRQLLTFSRQQVIQMKVIDLNETVENLLKMLRHLLGENVRLDFQRARAPLWIQGDAGMVEQVVTNLCVNARDAMLPRGGRLTVALSSVTLTADEAKRNSAARAGAFVRLTVSDTGVGMAAETIEHIFEPFFTTKQVGKGTGLGLATVFGITKQHQGWIEVRSELGHGSTFEIFLPTAAPAALVPTPADVAPGRAVHACILLVEDEQLVRDMVARTLRKTGYRVLEAVDGPSAIDIWSTRREEIDLLFSDMVMPNGLTGLDLVKRFKAERPDLKVVITSGYSFDLAQSGIPTDHQVAYLGKPYEVSQLVAFIHQCLAGHQLQS